MNYLSTTVNKIFTICCALLFMSNLAQAQETTHSAYSKYGLGLLQDKSFNGNKGMSGLGYAWRPFNYKPVIYDSLARSSANLNDRRSNFINPKNPASYSNLSLTVFEAAIFSTNVMASSGDQNQFYNSAQLSHVALAFPIGEKWGAGFGLRPFSSRGYEYSRSDVVNNNSLQYNYEGSGGLNQLYIAAAKEVGKQLSVGVSASYVFGTMVDRQRVVYDENTSSNFFNTLGEHNIKVSDMYIEGGFQYYKKLKNDYRLVVGLSVAPQSSLNAERSRLVRSYKGDIGFEKFKDTVVDVTTTQQKVDLSPTYGGGVSIEKDGKWVIGVDYSLQAWGNKPANSVEASFTDNHRITLGYESFSNLSSFGSYFKQMGYRAGAQYNSSIVQINGESIQEFGISFGVSLPLRKSFTTLNLALEAGKRGANRKQLIEENYFNIHFGVTINDRWFIQRKYD